LALFFLQRVEIALKRLFFTCFLKPMFLLVLALLISLVNSQGLFSEGIVLIQELGGSGVSGTVMFQDDDTNNVRTTLLRRSLFSHSPH
jgi:hypothetical protein